jgi:hypothetical protein
MVTPASHAYFNTMKVLVPSAIAAITACLLATAPTHVAHAAGEAATNASPIFGITIPPGFRDWKVISVAHEAGPNNDLRVVLGNDIAIQAYRSGKRPYPDGTIIARMAWRYTPSTENNRVFGRPQSFVAGTPINIQFDVKNIKRYATTNGWGFAQFKDGKPAGAAVQQTCYSCHALIKSKDFVFTQYAPTP